MESHALPRTRAVLEQGMAEGLHIGAQLHAAVRGRAAVDLVVGEGRPGVPMAADTLMIWLSSGKPVAAVAVAQLLERGLLDLDDPVEKHLPAFGQNGKAPITVRQLLTHTCGIRWPEPAWPRPWDEVIDRVCRMALERSWVPGERAGYHPATSWYLLGELVRVLDGRPYERYVREAIFLPLGMHDAWIGMPAEQYHAYGRRLGVMQQTSKSPPAPADPWAAEAAVVACRPGANAHGPVRQLARFYQMLLNGGSLEGVQLLRPATVSLFTTRQRVGMFDETFRHVMDWGLGFQVNSARYGADTVPYGYGPHATEETFGHGGMQSASAFADPAHGLACAVVCNGMPGEPAHQRRMRAVLGALYEDLGLA